MTKTLKSGISLKRVLFGQAVPFRHSAVAEIEVGKLDVKSIDLVDSMLVVLTNDTTLYIPWSRVACSW